jgi:hypothetical protein
MMRDANMGAVMAKQGRTKAKSLDLRSFDLYTKIEDDFKVTTATGAYISIAGWIVIVILLSGAFWDYMTPNVKEHMVVDTSLGSSLTVNLDITFHALTCAEAHIDAMDVAGDNQLNIEDAFTKQRLSKEGLPIGTPSKTLVGGNVIHKDEKTLTGSEPRGRKDASGPTSCGSCYGAESDRFKCCNTCDEVKQAYMAKGWTTANIIKTADQCVEENENPYAGIEKGEGCRLKGSMTVNKVAGNFHIAHGESIVRDGRHIHQFLPQEAPHFNISHTIHTISFGDAYPNMPRNPLDDVSKIVHPEVGTGLYQYFLKVIPTVYMEGSDRISKRAARVLNKNKGWGRSQRFITNQYTMTERFRPLMLPESSKPPSGAAPGVPSPPTGKAKVQQAVLPGIFFIYDLSPFLIEVQKTSTPFLHFFTKACAIVGGVISVTGVIDSVLYRYQKGRGKKGQ